MAKLWLDDNTPPPDTSWTWAKTARAAMQALDSCSYEEVSLDHDLGEKLDGADVLKHIFMQAQDAEENCDDTYKPPRVIGIHTANPVERFAMMGMAQNIKGVELVTAESKTGQRF